MTAPIQLAISERDAARFWDRAATAGDPTECWSWRGHVSKKGYAVVSAMGNTRQAHRVSYIIANGPIPAGLQLDHLCRNRTCTNPLHLEAVTARENLVRSPYTLPGAAIRRTLCTQGHPLDGVKGKNRDRYCKTCHRTRTRQRRWAKKAAA